eukprot:6199477-Pleurochrysis_carterae.AAC.1
MGKNEQKRAAAAAISQLNSSMTEEERQALLNKGMGACRRECAGAVDDAWLEDMLDLSGTAIWGAGFGCLVKSWVRCSGVVECLRWMAHIDCMRGTSRL